MMKTRLIAVAMAALAGATMAQTPTKKELAAKLVTLQQAGIEQVSVGLVENPARQMTEQARIALQQQVPADKREAVAKQVEAEIKKYMEESTPIIRERGSKIAASTLAPLFEEKFSEDELKQLVAWLESPVSKKYQQQVPEMQNVFLQKLVTDARPLVEPKIQALDNRLRVLLNAPPATSAGAASARPARPAASAAPAAPKSN